MQTMLHRFVILLNGRIASSWLVFTIDILIIVFSFLFANIIRFNFILENLNWSNLFYQSILVVVVCAIFFLVFRSYASIIRHTSVTDAIKVFKAVLLASFSLYFFNYLESFFANLSFLSIPLSVLFIFFTNSLFALIFTRILIKLIYHTAFHHGHESTTNVLIFGAGELGIITKNTLESKGSLRYKVVGFIDDNPGKIGKSIDGVRVYCFKDINKEFVVKKEVDDLIFSIQNIDPAEKQKIMDSLIELGITIKTIPPVEHWINGQLKVNQIEKLRIEDLLQRDPIILKNPKVSEVINDKIVMVTGGAGSIGSEIVRQLIAHSPYRIIVIDNAETPVFELRQELLGKGLDIRNTLRFIIADVTDLNRMDAIFDMYKPSIIYHAAAYKHVPLMEDHPEEALRVNVFGTKIIADMAVKHGAERFVMVSTDKAVRPTNVMGASKRLAEMYCQSLGQSKKSHTKFITTRFGNVLGSNGSVVKIFRKQIKAGGPVTVTHPEITRFFMTIPEACQLVLEASIMGKGSEIFVFDMGKAVKVVDLAKKMIVLAGLEPGKNIDIVFSGLRPGEKLYEELLSSSENTVKTYHPKIMIARVDQILNGSVSYMIKELKETLYHYQNDQYKIVALLKKAIPEYVSNNSRFQKLDNHLAEIA